MERLLSVPLQHHPSGRSVELTQPSGIVYLVLLFLLYGFSMLAEDLPRTGLYGALASAGLGIVLACAGSALMWHLGLPATELVCWALVGSHMAIVSLVLVRLLRGRSAKEGGGGCA